MVRLLGRVSRIQNYKMKERDNLKPSVPRRKFAPCTGSYQKVKETAFEPFGRSGGVARFSIAAFASEHHEAASRTLDRGGLLEDKPQSR
jgi:hypothetical protein